MLTCLHNLSAFNYPAHQIHATSRLYIEVYFETIINNPYAAVFSTRNQVWLIFTPAPHKFFNTICKIIMPLWVLLMTIGRDI